MNRLKPALLMIFMTSVLAPGCVSSNEKLEEPVAPEIHGSMPLDQALQAGIDFGGSTLQEVKALVRRRHEQPRAAALLHTALIENVLKYEVHQLLNAGHLYLATAPRVSPIVFERLVASGRPDARKLGWRIAAMKPSLEMKTTIEKELTRSLLENDEDSVLIPEMATALVANDMSESYSFVRQGLLATGHEEFAKAMVALSPTRASSDFLDYLAMAPASELRQLTLSSVNLYSCLIALRHLTQIQAPVSHPRFSHLFLYAVSRNQALAELAQSALEMYLPSHKAHLAHMLSRHEVWVQMAYLENARRNLNPKINILLNELQEVAAHSDVIKEIQEIRR